MCIDSVENACAAGGKDTYGSGSTQCPQQDSAAQSQSSITTSPVVAVHKAASLGVSTALQTFLNSFKCLLVDFSGIPDKGCATL